MPGRIEGEAELDTIPTALLPPTPIGAVPARIASDAALTATSSGTNEEAIAAADIAAETADGAPPGKSTAVDGTDDAPGGMCGEPLLLPPRFETASEDGLGPEGPA